MRITASSSSHLATLARFKFNIVYDCTNWDISKFHCITRLNIKTSFSSLYCIADFQTLWLNDISFLTIYIAKKCNSTVSVWVILNSFYFRRDIEFVSFEIDNSI